MMTIGLILGYIVIEVGLRLYYPDGGVPAAHLEHTSDEEFTAFHEHEECGYLPIVDHGEYGPYGCLANSYRVDEPRGERLLFVGDSVTHRAKIVDALKALYGDRYEYWNAGVESFNTMQEWVFYRDHNSKIKPRQVILTFHNNDFRATPIVVREKGQIKVFQPGLDINPWLFRKSYVYRWAWPKPEDRPLREQQVMDGLLGFRDSLAKDGIEFKIILHPMLKPYSDWNEDEIRSRDLSIEYFKKLNLPYFDLLPALEEALQDGIVVTEAPEDYLHPSEAMAERFAQALYQQGLLQKR